MIEVNNSVLALRLVRTVFLCLYCIPLFIIPKFAETFSAFGVELPVITEIIVRYYYLYPALFFALWYSSTIFGRQDQLWAVIKLNIVAYTVIAVLTLIGLYLPAFTQAGNI